MVLKERPRRNTIAAEPADLSVSGKDLSDVQKAEVVDVIYEAFAQKLHKLIVLSESETTIKRVLPSVINFSQSIIAMRDGDICGVMFMNLGKKSFIRYDWSIARREFGVLGSVYRRVNHFFVQSRRRNPKELNIQAFSVREEFRNEGIGSQMLHTLELFGVRHGYEMLSLEVVNTNHRAKELYQKRGFATRLTKSTWPFTKAAGFSAYDYMVKEL